MGSVEEFYRARQQLKKTADCLDLPAAKPTFIALDCSKLPAKYPLADVDDVPKPFDAFFNFDFTSKIDAISPLSQALFAELEAAGGDPYQQRYTINIQEVYTLPQGAPVFWHADLRLHETPDFRERILIGSQITRTVWSNIYPTVILPIHVAQEYPDIRDREILWFCKFNAVSRGGNIRQEWLNDLPQFIGEALGSLDPEGFVQEITEAADQAKAASTVLEGACAVHFDMMTPHAVTDRVCESHHPEAEKRHRVMITGTPLTIPGIL